MKKSIIKGTGFYVPPHVVTNDDLSKIMDTSDEWIRQRTGIRERRWVTKEDLCGTSDLGTRAACMAMDNAGWKPEDVDFIIFATLSPDIFFPGGGCLLARNLELDSTPALDIRQQCTGFLYGFSTADAYIKAGLASKVLLVCAEVHSTGLDKSTRGRDVTVIFGDGAAALCIEGEDTDENVGLIASALHADGHFAEALMTELPASNLFRRVPEDATPDDPRFYPVMDGGAIFKKAVRALPKVTMEVLDKAGMELSDIDLVVPHQANKRINQAFGQFLKLPEDKVFHNIEKYGNTTAASIPLALHEAVDAGLTGKSGDVVLFAAFGAGLTWGASLYKFP